MQRKSNAPEMCHDGAAGIPYKSFFRVDFISDGDKVMLIKTWHTGSQQKSNIMFYCTAFNTKTLQLWEIKSMMCFLLIMMTSN